MNDTLDQTCGKPDELTMLLESLVNREITKAEMKRLNSILKEDPAARHAYLEAMSLEAAVAHEFPSIQSAAPRPSKAMKPLQWLTLAAAACLIFAALYAIGRGDFEEAPAQVATPRTSKIQSVRSDSPILSVTRMAGAELRFGNNLVAEGDQVSRGRLNLIGGAVELTFHCGVVMQLNAPAELDVESAFRAYLVRGKALIAVPKQALGFVVYTPNSFIKNMGARFELKVFETAGTELSVISGLVNISPSGGKGLGKAREIKEGSVVIVAEGKINDIPDGEKTADFSKTFAEEKAPPYLHWSFDEWEGSHSLERNGGYGFDFTKGGMPSEPAVIDGKFGKALRLDGRSHYAISNYAGIGGGKARSVAFWVRIQPGASRDTPNGIVSWGRPQKSEKWQIAWNAQINRGVLGAVRVEFGNGFVIGSTDLRNGVWHHVAVVFLGGAHADVSTHVRIYVDGVLEPLTDRKQGQGSAVINTAINDSNTEPLVLGKYLGIWKDRDPFYFEGDIDEVIVCDGVLQPGRIVRFMEENRPE